MNLRGTMGLSWHAAIVAAALAATPYFFLNLGLIAFHRGSIIHMSKGEWTVWTAASTLGLVVESVVVIAVSAALTRKASWMFAPTAIGIFAALATAIQPSFWPTLLRPSDAGIAYWVFLIGVLTTVLALAIRARSKAKAGKG